MECQSKFSMFVFLQLSVSWSSKKSQKNLYIQFERSLFNDPKSQAFSQKDTIDSRSMVEDASITLVAIFAERKLNINAVITW